MRVLMLPAHAAAVPWVAKRWHSMRVLALTITANFETSLSMALMQGGLGSLDELHLICENDNGACRMLTAWVLKEAGKRLRVLNITAHFRSCISLSPPSCLEHLEHLVLVLRCKDRLGLLSEALQQLQQLETLCLQNCFPCPMPTHSLKLRLGSLLRLRKASLVNFVPARLQLPPACKLHVQLSGYGSACEPVWDGVAARITSFAWAHSDDVSVLPPIINAACNLRRLRIRGSKVGTDFEPLSLAPAAHVAWLCIKGRTVLVEVPELQAWGFLGVISSGRLGVRFKSVPAFVSRLPGFALEFESMAGRDVLDLADMTRVAGGTPDGSRIGCWTMHNTAQDTIAHVVGYPSLDPPELDEGFCACGACHPCLAKARCISPCLWCEPESELDTDTDSE